MDQHPRSLTLQPILHSMTVVAVALSVGIFVGDRSDFGSGYWLILAFLAWPAVMKRSRPLVETIAAGTLIFACGAASLTLSHSIQGNDLARITSRMRRDDAPAMTISGQIDSFVIEDSSRIRFTLSLERIHGVDHVIPVHGLARVTIFKDEASSEPTNDSSDDQCLQMLRGMRVVLHGRAYRPNRNTNPADFNYRKFLKRKGISTLVYIKSLKDCLLVNKQSDRVAQVRSWFKSAVKTAVPGSSRALSTALITGDRSGLDASTRLQFAESGLMHLLAISGLHVLFVGLTAYGLIKSMLVRLRFEWRVVEAACTTLTVGLLCGYALITGATPSVVRASIMAGVYLAAKPLYRSSNSLNSLGTAAVVVLLIDPDSLFTAGFQLSFLAVFGLITAGGTISKWVNHRFAGRTARWSFGLLGASAVATISTAPVMMDQFGYVPLAGLVLNLVAIPLASGLLVASICAALLSTWWTPFAMTIGHAADLLSTLLELLAKIGGDSAAWSLLRIPGHAAYLCVPVAMTISLYPRLRGRTRVSWMIVALSLPAIDVVYHASVGDYYPSVDVIFFDIGHGDAALIRFPSGSTLLIDAGNRSRSWDYGERVIIPHLKQNNIRKLDAVVVSHPHGDHFGGLPSILRQIPVGCVYDNGKEVNTKLFKEYRSLIAAKVGCHKTVAAGSRLEIDPLIRLDVLAPPQDYEVEGENDESVVLKLTFGSTSFLFTGDVEQNAEKILVDDHCSTIRSDVVKVPHHGSRTSSTPGLVTCTMPTWAVVSVGRPDKYGLPDDEILQRWRETGARVLTTYETGAVRMRSNGSVISRIH